MVRKSLTFAKRRLIDIVLYGSALFFIFPLYWMITGSFENESTTVKIPPELFPSPPTMVNYAQLVQQGSVFSWLLNSIIVAGVSMVVGVLLSTMAGYALARKRFVGKKIIFTAVILTMLVPRDLGLVPLFTLMKQLHLVDTLLSCIIPLIAMPFGVFLMRQFSQTVPEELLEAAKVDGCSELRIFVSIFMPMVKPAMAALSIFIFSFAWNDYLWQMVMLTDPSHYTVPVGISSFISAYVAQYGLQMAAATIGFLPLFIVFVVLQKHFVKGITLGGLKG